MVVFFPHKRLGFVLYQVKKALKCLFCYSIIIQSDYINLYQTPCFSFISRELCGLSWISSGTFQWKTRPLVHEVHVKPDEQLAELITTCTPAPWHPRLPRRPGHRSLARHTAAHALPRAPQEASPLRLQGENGANTEFAQGPGSRNIGGPRWPQSWLTALPQVCHVGEQSFGHAGQHFCVCELLNIKHTIIIREDQVMKAW